MKHLLRILALCILVTPVAGAAAEPAPRAIVAFVNLVLGSCMAEKGGQAILADPIDPRAVGVPVAADNDDPRLGPESVRIPSTDGVVYHDGDAENCFVYADGVDAEGAVTRVQDALKESGLPVMPFADATQADASGVRRRTVVYGVMVSPTAPTLPLITLSYPVETPALLTGGVRAGKFE